MRTPSKRCRRIGLSLALVAGMTLCGCAKQPAPNNPEIKTASEIADIDHIPQALSHFAKRDPNTPLRTEGSSDMDYRHFRKLFFSAWNQSKPDS